MSSYPNADVFTSEEVEVQSRIMVAPTVEGTPVHIAAGGNPLQFMGPLGGTPEFPEFSEHVIATADAPSVEGFLINWGPVTTLPMRYTVNPCEWIGMNVVYAGQGYIPTFYAVDVSEYASLLETYDEETWESPPTALPTVKLTLPTEISERTFGESLSISLYGLGDGQYWAWVGASGPGAINNGFDVYLMEYDPSEGEDGGLVILDSYSSVTPRVHVPNERSPVAYAYNDPDHGGDHSIVKFEFDGGSIQVTPVLIGFDPEDPTAKIERWYRSGDELIAIELKVRPKFFLPPEDPDGIPNAGLGYCTITRRSTSPSGEKVIYHRTSGSMAWADICIAGATNPHTGDAFYTIDARLQFYSLTEAWDNPGQSGPPIRSFYTYYFIDVAAGYVPVRVAHLLPGSEPLRFESWRDGYLEESGILTSEDVTFSYTTYTVVNNNGNIDYVDIRNIWPLGRSVFRIPVSDTDDAPEAAEAETHVNGQNLIVGPVSDITDPSVFKRWQMPYDIRPCNLGTYLLRFVSAILRSPREYFDNSYTNEVPVLEADGGPPSRMRFFG